MWAFISGTSSSSTPPNGCGSAVSIPNHSFVTKTASEPCCGRGEYFLASEAGVTSWERQRLYKYNENAAETGNGTAGGRAARVGGKEAKNPNSHRNSTVTPPKPHRSSTVTSRSLPRS